MVSTPRARPCKRERAGRMSHVSDAAKPTGAAASVQRNPRILNISPPNPGAESIPIRS